VKGVVTFVSEGLSFCVCRHVVGSHQCRAAGALNCSFLSLWRSASIVKRATPFLNYWEGIFAAVEAGEDARIRREVIPKWFDDDEY
jgi:hypothetical protein